MSDWFGERLSLHAISAELAELGYRICVETIYQACYDVSTRNGLPSNCWVLLRSHSYALYALQQGSGLPSKCWVLLPRARRRKSPSCCSQVKRLVLGGWRRVCERPL